MPPLHLSLHLPRSSGSACRRSDCLIFSLFHRLTGPESLPERFPGPHRHCTCLHAGLHQMPGNLEPGNPMRQLRFPNEIPRNCLQVVDSWIGAHPQTGRGIGVSGTKFGSARIACLGFFLVCAAGSAMAQEADQVNESVSENPAVAVAPATDGGGENTNPLVPSELEQQGAPAAAPAQGSGLHGNFFERLGQFYKEDWTGKLPSSPTPPRRPLDAPWTRRRFRVRTGDMADRLRLACRMATNVH